MVLPPPPLSLLCIISIVTLYLMIVYAIIGFISKSELFRVDPHGADHPSSGLSRQELQTLRSFSHKINEGIEESLSCSICLDDFKEFEVCKRFPSSTPRAARSGAPHGKRAVDAAEAPPPHRAVVTRPPAPEAARAAPAPPAAAARSRRSPVAAEMGGRPAR
ncbi:hypothetical protein R6Q57_000630 [Mikania cordata]